MRALDSALRNPLGQLAVLALVCVGAAVAGKVVGVALRAMPRRRAR